MDRNHCPSRAACLLEDVLQFMPASWTSGFSCPQTGIGRGETLISVAALGDIALP